jgi:hypothetical protein
MELYTNKKKPTAQIAHLVFCQHSQRYKTIRAIFPHRYQTVDKFEKINHRISKKAEYI